MRKELREGGCQLADVGVNGENRDDHWSARRAEVSEQATDLLSQGEGWIREEEEEGRTETDLKEGGKGSNERVDNKQQQTNDLWFMRCFANTVDSKS